MQSFFIEEKVMPRKYGNLILECSVEEPSECQKKIRRDAAELYFSAIRRANSLVAGSGGWGVPPPASLPATPVETIDVEEDEEPAPALTLAPLPRADCPLVDDSMFGGTNLTTEIPPPQRISLRTVPAAAAAEPVPVVSLVSEPSDRSASPPAVVTTDSNTSGALSERLEATGGVNSTTTRPRVLRPKEPEKPLSPYLRYNKSVRETVKQQNQDLNMAEISKIIGSMWRNLPESEKQKFVDEYLNENVNYKKAVRDYQDCLTAQSKVSAVSAPIPASVTVIPVVSVTEVSPSTAPPSLEVLPLPATVSITATNNTTASATAANQTTITTTAANQTTTTTTATNQITTTTTATDETAVINTTATDKTTTTTTKNTTTTTTSKMTPTTTVNSKITASVVAPSKTVNIVTNTTSMGTSALIYPVMPSSAAEEQQVRSFPALHAVIRTPHSLMSASKTLFVSRRTMLDQRVKKVLLYTPSQLTEWLIQTRLVRANQTCPAHPVTWSGQPRKLRLGMFTDSDKLARSGGYVWVKTCCRPKFLSVYFGSLFDSSKLADANTSAVSILKLVYHWSCQTPVNNVTHWLKLRPAVVDEVFALLRAVCILKMGEQSPLMGIGGSRIQIGLVSLGIAGIDGKNKNVKVEVLGVKDEVSGEIRMVGFEPRVKNRIRAVVAAVQEWVNPDCHLLLDHSINPVPFRAHFRRVESAPDGSKETQGNIMHYLRQYMPRMFQNCLMYLKPTTICQIIAEISWREKYGRDPNTTFSNMILHLSTMTQQNDSPLIDSLNKVLQCPTMDLRREPRKQARPAKESSAKEAPVQEPAVRGDHTDNSAKRPPPTSSSLQAKRRRSTKDMDAAGGGVAVPELVDADQSDAVSEVSAAPSDAASDSTRTNRRAVKKQRRRGKGKAVRVQTADDRQLGAFFKLGDLSSVVMPNLSEMRCWECKLPLTHPRHLTGVYACRKCRYATCCEKIYPVHRRVFHSTGVLPVFSTGTPVKLQSKLYCSCGYGTDSGNRLALHMARCDCRTAKPAPDSAVKTESSEEISIGRTGIMEAADQQASEPMLDQEIVKHDDSLDLDDCSASGMDSTSDIVDLDQRMVVVPGDVWKGCGPRAEDDAPHHPRVV